MAAVDVINPVPAWSIASILMLFDTPLEFVYVNCQHVPQLGEFHPPTADAEPM
jgi:hypothetical protein